MEKAGIKEHLLLGLIPAETPGAFDGNYGDATAVQDIINADQVDRTGNEEHQLSQINLQCHAYSLWFGVKG